MLEAHAFHFEPMDFGSEERFLGFRLLQLPLELGDFHSFDLKLKVKLAENRPQLPDASPLAKKISFQRSPAPASDNAHRIDYFSIGSDHRAIKPISVPQGYSGLQISDNHNIRQQILGDVAVAIFDADHFQQRRDHFRFTHGERLVLPARQLERDEAPPTG